MATVKDAGFAPLEVALFHERARLRGAVEGAMTTAEKNALLQQLSELEQKIPFRLETMRAGGSL